MGFNSKKHLGKWAKYTVPWLVTVKLEIRLQRSKSKRELEKRLLEELPKDSNTRDVSSQLIQRIEERRVQMPVQVRKTHEQFVHAHNDTEVMTESMTYVIFSE